MGASGATAPRARLQVGCGVLTACPLRVCVCVCVCVSVCLSASKEGSLCTVWTTFSPLGSERECLLV